MFSLDGLIGLLVGLVIGFVIGYLVKRNNLNLETTLLAKYGLLNSELKEKYAAIAKQLDEVIAGLKAKLGA
jgi:uncharacterized membrane-anchored protein YhcB (DUF1043 family)